MPRSRATNTSALAVGVLSPYVKTKGGEFTCDGGGSGNERVEGHSFRRCRVSASDPGSKPWPAGDIAGRVFRHLRGDVFVPRDIALGVVAIVGARRRVPRADLHHPA